MGRRWTSGTDPSDHRTVVAPTAPSVDLYLSRLSYRDPRRLGRPRGRRLFLYTPFFGHDQTFTSDLESNLSHNCLP